MLFVNSLRGLSATTKSSKQAMLVRTWANNLQRPLRFQHKVSLSTQKSNETGVVGQAGFLSQCPSCKQLWLLSNQLFS
ncbi:hypothetical protein VTO42DRAFT_2306 [Malbranchea cinnamomea]